MSASDEQYASAVDRWLIVALFIAPLVSVGALAAAVIAGEGILAALLGPLIVAGIYGGLLFPLHYRLGADGLLIRFGLVRQRIPYEKIRSVGPSHNPLSSPALSLRRLRVDYGSGVFSFVLISPQRRDEFLSALAARTGLVRDGDRLSPRP